MHTTPRTWELGVCGRAAARALPARGILRRLMYRSDARYHHSYYNEHDFVTAADQYPKFGASREELVGHAKKLHGLTTEIIDNVQQDGHVLDLERLFSNSVVRRRTTPLGASAFTTT